LLCGQPRLCREIVRERAASGFRGKSVFQTLWRAGEGKRVCADLFVPRKMTRGRPKRGERGRKMKPTLRQERPLRKRLWGKPGPFFHDGGEGKKRRRFFLFSERLRTLRRRGRMEERAPATIFLEKEKRREKKILIGRDKEES